MLPGFHDYYHTHTLILMLLITNTTAHLFMVVIGALKSHMNILPGCRNRRVGNN